MYGKYSCRQATFMAKIRKILKIIITFYTLNENIINALTCTTYVRIYIYILLYIQHSNAVYKNMNDQSNQPIRQTATYNVMLL